MTRSDVQLMLDVKAGDATSFELLLQHIGVHWLTSCTGWFGTGNRRKT